ncbi:MAG: enoyl-CoA hydratase-related protein [Cytophagales bacterium]|nr:enoyl-CoA hydratase-related protein [Cytophagales bacterium]
MSSLDNYRYVNLFRPRGRILQIEVSVPDRLNALSRGVLDDLEKAFQYAFSDQETHAILLSGAGEKAFVAGADIKELSKLSAQEGKILSERGQSLFQQIEDSSKPVLCAVQGYALGGGAELAMACHLRVGSEDIRVGQPEINLGTLPGYGGTQRLPRLIGLTKATELLLTGDTLDGKGALHYGWLNKLVPRGSLIEESLSLLEKIVKKSPLAVREILRCLRASQTGDAYAIEAESFASLCDSYDFKEGTCAFLEKRSPSFQGR